jgi:signal transduction histidine kinase
MMNTLYAKLVLVLFLLISLVGGVFIIAALYSAYMYQQEVSQRLNRDLAAYIANEHVLLEDGRVMQQNLQSLFDKAMIINPSLELYLLDVHGNILAHSDALHRVTDRQVSLQAVEEMLAGGSMPVFGDDPQNAGGKKVFSVAPIVQQGARQGYVYAVLGSEQVDHITQLLQHSYILQWSAGAIVIAVLFSVTAGLLVFFLLTRKLRTLSQSMAQFRNSNFENPPHDENARLDPADDIDRMTLTFQQMAERIHCQMQKLQQTDSLRRELVANVSHDLRTPLASLNGYLETLLLKDGELTPEERRSYLQVAHRHSERLSHLVVELFELAKLEANELKPNRETFSLAELVYDVAQKFDLRAQQKNIHIQLEVDDNLPYVEADVGMIERVLDNLIDNALRHTPQHGSIRLKLVPGHGRVEVVVADTGYGIAEDELPDIFRRFYRKGDAEDSQGSGAGLGLAIAYRIVELHGSQLSVSSLQHQGTTFEFDLPAQNFA